MHEVATGWVLSLLSALLSYRLLTGNACVTSNITHILEVRSLARERGKGIGETETDAKKIGVWWK